MYLPNYPDFSCVQIPETQSVSYSWISGCLFERRTALWTSRSREVISLSLWWIAKLCLSLEFKQFTSFIDIWCRRRCRRRRRVNADYLFNMWPQLEVLFAQVSQGIELKKMQPYLQKLQVKWSCFAKNNVLPILFLVWYRTWIFGCVCFSIICLLCMNSFWFLLVIHERYAYDLNKFF